MKQHSNRIFFGCNYNDKAVKQQFDNLKIKIEKDTPVSCVIIDKRANKAAKDLWVDIQDEIEQSSFCIFDLTGFRPNVVLELGFAIARKNQDQIYITFRERKSKGEIPKWLLSDIGHLNRMPYKLINDLESQIRKQIELIEYMKNFHRFLKACESTGNENKYGEFGLRILQVLRDEGPKTERQLRDITVGTNIRIAKMKNLLKQNRLLRKEPGRYGRYYIYY